MTDKAQGGGRPQVHSSFHYKDKQPIHTGNSLARSSKHSAEIAVLSEGPTAFLEVFTGCITWHLGFALKDTASVSRGQGRVEADYQVLVTLRDGLEFGCPSSYFCVCLKKLTINT